MKDDACCQRSSNPLYQISIKNDKFRSKDKWEQSIFKKSNNSNNNSGLKFFKEVMNDESFKPSSSLNSDESN